jgi:hypothetical protein
MAQAPTQVDFYFDPVCPFAWVTSRWLLQAQKVRPIEVDWRFICLWMVNAEKNYDTEFPQGYISGHQRGRNLLRVAAAAKDGYGPEAIGPLYTAYGDAFWSVKGGREAINAAADVEPLLAAADLPVALASAFDDERWDAQLAASTSEAIERTGKDVGTPIITYHLPAGDFSFFGPVLSAIPEPDAAGHLWDTLTTLVQFPTFAEIKRTNRNRLDLPAFKRD